jgi:hypothetical protein
MAVCYRAPFTQQQVQCMHNVAGTVARRGAEIIWGALAAASVKGTQDPRLLLAWCFMGYSDKELAQLFSREAGSNTSRTPQSETATHRCLCKMHSRLDD